MPAVSWPWAPAWGSLEPPRRDVENAQKMRKNGGKMAEIRPKTCEQGRDRRDQLARPAPPAAAGGPSPAPPPDGPVPLALSTQQVSSCARLCGPFILTLLCFAQGGAMGTAATFPAAPGSLSLPCTPHAVAAGTTQRFYPPFLGHFSPVLRRLFAVLSRFPASWRRDGENGRKMA